MPKNIERKLKAEAKKKQLNRKQTNRYVYGTIARIERRRQLYRKKK